jgi:hypothetical protein
MKKILAADILKKNIVLIVVEKNFEIYITSNPVMVAVFGSDEQILPQFGNRADIITTRAFGPKTFGRFFFLRRAGQNPFFYSFKPA